MRLLGRSVVASLVVCASVAVLAPLAAADPPTEPESFSATFSLSGTADQSLASVDLDQDDDHKYTRFDLNDQSGTVYEILIRYDTARLYVIDPVHLTCTVYADSTSAQASWAWLSSAIAAGTDTWQASPASSFFVAGNDLAELFSLLGVPSSAAPVELTEDGSAAHTPTALAAGGASLDVQQFTPGTPVSSTFNVPAACTTGGTGPIAVSQAAPLSATVKAGYAYSGQLAASAYTDLPATFATTTSSPGLTVSETGAVSAPSSLAPGDYSASGTTSDGVGDTGTWTFTLAVQDSAPGVPTGVSAAAGDGQATVSFTAPDEHGSAITGYTVTASPGGQTATGPGSPIVISGLTDGVPYTFTVTATNALGTGGASTSNQVIPVDTHPPSAPAGLSGDFADGSLDLAWQPSTDNVAVDHYELYLNGVPIQRIAGTQTHAAIRRFEPSGESVYTVRAFDAAGNESSALASVNVEWTARPARSPKDIPRWAWQLLAWQEHGHGTQPAHPNPLPDWYAAWKAWREEPFKLLR